VFVALSFVLPATALGVVHIDPNGPAGQQYAVPLDNARGQFSDHSNARGVPGSKAKAPLFGEGIGPSGPSGGESLKAQAQAQGSGGGRKSSTPGQTGAPGTRALIPLSSLRDAGSGSGSQLALAGLIAAVLLVGAGLGFGVRRLRPAA
jgi:hypothetical protein